MDIKQLLERINNEPSILFLGQAYLGIQEKSDLFLRYVNEFVLDNAIEENALTYNALLDHLEPSRKNQTIKKLLEVSEAIPVPEWLLHVSKLRWSSVFTSAIDSITQKAFFSYGRQYKSIFSKNDNPRNYMSKSILHGTYLFGNVCGEDRYMPPFSEEDLDDKLGDASILFGRIAELIGNYGLLVIDGYDPDNDWLDPVTLASVLSHFSPGNVFVFSANEAFMANPRLARFIKSGRITAENRSLYECLLEAGAFVDDEEPFEPIEDEGVPLTVNRELKYLPFDIYNDISQKYILLDDRVLKKAPVNNLEEAFLKFLREASVRPIWSAFLQGFYFRRVFDDALKQAVETELDSEVLDSRTVILRGQNGTGKTVSLCHLAMEIKRGLKYPVIFIPRETTPDAAVLDRFISWLENRLGAERTVIIWDMGAYRSEIYEMVTLQRTLNHGGRKVLVVGSSYANGEEPKNAVFIDIAPEIDPEREIPALREVLQRINSAYVHRLDSALPQIGGHGNLFLAAMYELFHDLHTNLAQGVAKEVDKAEKALSRQVNRKRRVVSDSPFAKLRTAFGLEEICYYTEMSYEIERAIQEVSDLVCVASQYGVDLTLDLLLRVTDISDKYEFVKDLSQNSMIAVIQDGDYNYLVRFRSTLEAQLYIKDRFAGIEQEIDCVRRIIANIKTYSNLNDNVELTQLLNLLFNYGPNGPQKSKYKSYYLTLANALKDLREKQNFFVPSLVLQEANFIRESFKGSENSEEKRKYLEMAQNILREAIDMMRQNGETRLQSYASLLVELASNLSEFVFADGQDYRESLETYREIKTNLDKARSISPQNYHPVDVYLKSSMQVYENAENIDEKNNILTDMLKTIDDARHANTEFEDRPEFQSRVFRINQYLKNTEIAESYYQELLKKGSATGVYLRAKKILGDYVITASPDAQQYEKIEQALNLLTENQAVVFSDARSLLLLIQLYWIKYTGIPIFSVERLCPALGKAQWDYLDNLCTRYLSMETAVPVALPLFLKAVRLFINEDDYKSMEYFEQAKKAPGPSRVPIYLIHCDEMGKPRKYKGKLDTFNNGKGKIKLLHRSIKAHFTARSFDIATIEKEQEFKNLAIGFNLMGPVALPLESFGD